ncbi:MAG TPA: 50S ribosomal protein L13 [Candidatus Parcubacteria bacterium]|nr:50S ribosomal protein L13 [Candidatus Parcubacteria bacterium]
MKTRKTYTIDADGKPLGRLAAEIAVILRGKNEPDFAPNKDEGCFVIVKNIKRIKLTGRKMDSKAYYRHSGYPGGLKRVPMKKVFEKDPGEVLKKAVFGMLPKNRLRAKQIKRLRVEQNKS